jgi:hypothetical protein
MGHKPLSPIRRKKCDNKILELLLNCDGIEDIRAEIKQYWHSAYAVNELLRFSDDQKDAFEFLRKVFKYQLYEKRDGSIVNAVIDDSGLIISDPEKVNAMLIKRMKEIQFDESLPGYCENGRFHTLEPISIQKFRKITQRLTVGKALSLDLISDVVFGYGDTEGASTKLRDIWSIDLGKSEFSSIFKCRLIALNKDHPRTPTYDRFRPIVVSSPLVKLIESRFLSRLQKYLLNRLHASQTGFVPYCGIFVNITRALDRIKYYVTQGRHVYGLFVDFANAYNSVVHAELFDRLNGILKPEEILYLRSLYSRISIHSGRHSMQPNAGVAQGSILSPALFDIYLEPLLAELTGKLGLPTNDVLAYADDLLVFTSSRAKIRDVIDLIERFSSSNGLKLNKSKSGIVEFMGRHSKPYLNCQNILGIPVLTEYKYLGLWINSKLTLDKQIKHIYKKNLFIKSKLAPILDRASLDYRKNLWTTFIRPLLEFCLPMYWNEPAKTNRELLERVVRSTFKSMTKLSKTTPNFVVKALCGFKVERRSRYLVELSRLKWEARLNRTLSEDTGSELSAEEAEPNICRFIPRNGAELLNLYTMVCPRCRPNGKAIMSWNHLVSVHHIPVYNPILLFKELSRTTEGTEASRRENIQEFELAAESHQVDPEYEWGGLFAGRKESRAQRLYDSYQRINKETAIIKEFISK